MSDYEIRLFKRDGSLSIIMAVVANGPSDARNQAWATLTDDIVKAEIWSGLDYFETIAAL
jgi:hypothetical protein